jgi:high-affinity nickel-transport protein
MLGVALVVYGLGLRHAVDADHIAAIDNVTRKLMQSGQRPVGVGLFFALGHSTIVVLVSVAVAGLASLVVRFEALGEVGGVISTGVSALFLIAVAVMNITIFVPLYRSFRRMRAGAPYVEEDLDILLNSRGLLARLLRPLFQLVTRSWHMAPLGFLFGLGFDTATEVAMFGVAGAQAANGLSIGAVLVFPALFAAGMMLVDTTDGVLMLGAYDWAFVKPMRKLYYNMTITLISILVAVLIGGLEGLNLAADALELKGPFWAAVAKLGGDMNTLGFAIIGLFLASWLVSFCLYRALKLDAFDAPGSRA